MARGYQGTEFTYITVNNYQDISIVWGFPLSSNLSPVIVLGLEVPDTLVILSHTQN